MSQVNSRYLGIPILKDSETTSYKERQKKILYVITLAFFVLQFAYKMIFIDVCVNLL